MTYKYKTIYGMDVIRADLWVNLGSTKEIIFEDVNCFSMDKGLCYMLRCEMSKKRMIVDCSVKDELRSTVDNTI